VSAQVSPKDRNPALRSVIDASVFNRSRVDRARRSQHVTGFELVQHAAELAAVGLGSARYLAEHLPASGLGQLAHLGVNALAVRRYPRVAVFHALPFAIIAVESARNATAAA
jgi:hypothetical protein